MIALLLQLSHLALQRVVLVAQLDCLLVGELWGAAADAQAAVLARLVVARGDGRRGGTRRVAQV
jgi:chaperone required for assembly of F1-ATPase